MRIVSILIILASIIPLLAVDATESKVVQTGGTVFVWGRQTTVPTGLTDVIAIAADDRFNVVLRNDGAVIAWGYDGELYHATGLTDVIQVAANYRGGIVALKSNGKVIIWWPVSGSYDDLGWTAIVSIAAAPGIVLGLKNDGTVVRVGQDTVPGLTNIIKIAAGGTIDCFPGDLDFDCPFGLALKHDGSVVSLDNEVNVPSDLSGVIDIAAGKASAIALKGDGTVVQWRTRGQPQTRVVDGLTNVIAISAGTYQSLALKSDGTVVALGNNSYGQTNVPAGLTGVTAIAAGAYHNLVLMKTPVVVQPISVVTPNPTIGSGGVLTITQVLRNTLSINVTENYLASPPPGFTLIPGSCTSTIGGCVIESTPTSSQNQTGLARRALAEAQSNSQTLTWSGVIPGNGTVTITYQIRVGTQTGGSRQICLTPTLGGAPVTPTCVMVAPLSGPGNVPLAAGLPQKPGSVMIYNAYTSSANTALSETQITLTNTNPVDSVTVHLFFVDGATCTVADQTVTLTQSQTASFLASDVDPGVTGYLIAVAVDQNGCPTINNYLIGGAMVRFESGHHANLPAIGVSRLVPQTINCGTATVVATISFNGVEYDELPRALAIHSLPSLATGNSPLLIVNRLGGNLTNGAERLGTLAGLLFDDSEVSRSFMLNGGECQVRGLIGNNFPRTVPRYTTVIPAGRTGWMKFWANGDEAITGAMINEAPSGLSGGHNLHALTTTASATLTIPVIPAS
jgi:hypothetical protein